MTNNNKIAKLALTDILEKNPKVSKSVIDQYRELREKLEKLGVSVESTRYTLSHPFDKTTSYLPHKREKNGDKPR